MPVYEYTALDRGGKRKRGIIDADSPVLARNKLRTDGIYPVSLQETSGPAKERARRKGVLPGLFNRVSSAELSALTRQLSVMLRAGVTLVGSLDALVAQTDQPVLKRVLAQMKESVNEGNSLAHAFSLHPSLFSPIYVNMVRAGEASGALDIVLQRLAEFSEHQQAVRNRFRAALAYPAFMFLIGSGILLFLVTFIVPNIAQVFQDMEQTLPLPTQILISTGVVLKSYWWLVGLGLVAVVLVVRRLLRRPAGRRFSDRLKLRLPILGPIQRKMLIARFARTLGTLLEGGVPVLTALGIVRNVVQNTQVGDTLDTAAEEVEAGKSLAASLRRSPWFPAMAVQMVSVGEQSGELEGMLNTVADIYEGDVESRITALTSLLEPLMILIMGISVGFIVVSILLPIFEMNQMIR
jgi:general secretion pathway protein F